MSDWVLCTSFFSSSEFVSEAIYVDLKYDDVCLLWLIVVCEWVGCSLFVMRCAWCCYVLCGCVNGASPVRFVLSLFYLCCYI